MSWKKKATVYYYAVETQDDEFFTNFDNTMATLLDTGNTSEVFEIAETRFLWKVLDSLDLFPTKTYFLGIVKERDSWPVWFKDDGMIASVPLEDGSLGEIAYLFVNPVSRFVLVFSAGSGTASGTVKKFLNLFTMDGSVQLTPVFEDKIDNRVMNWDMYRKVTLSLALPTGDDVSELMSTDAGKFMGLVDELGGLRIDMTVSMNRDKGSLGAARTREVVQELLQSEFCTKLVVKGADFEQGIPEEFDLKNAQLKYKEDLEVGGSYVTDLDAKQLLIRALQEHRNRLEAGV